MDGGVNQLINLRRFKPTKAIHNNRRNVVTNRVHPVTKNHILLKKEWWSGTAWLKTDGDYVMYASVKDARNSKQMYNAEHVSAN